MKYTAPEAVKTALAGALKGHNGSTDDMQGSILV